jgi:hypothetical protein
MTHATVFAAAGKTTAAMLFSGNLHVLSFPTAVHTFVIHVPIPFDKQPMDALGPKTRPLPSQGTHLP